MDTDTLLFATLAATLMVVAFQAWRLGNERRDVVLIGAVGGLFGAGTVLSVLV